MDLHRHTTTWKKSMFTDRNRNLIQTILNVFGNCSSDPENLSSTQSSVSPANHKMLLTKDMQLTSLASGAEGYMYTFLRRQKNSNCSFLSWWGKPYFALSYIFKQNWIWEEKTYGKRHSYPSFLNVHSLLQLCKEGGKRLERDEKHVFLWKSIHRNIYQLLTKHTVPAVKNMFFICFSLEVTKASQVCSSAQYTFLSPGQL